MWIGATYQAVQMGDFPRNGRLQTSAKAAGPNNASAGVIVRILAGAEGFEPSHGGTKNRCLTAWLRPSKSALYSG